MFADNMKKQMAVHGITQSELAKMTGIGRSSISQYLSGKNEPTDERKNVIAEAIGCRVVDLDATETTSFSVDTDTKMKRLSVDQAAKLLGMNHETVRKGLRQGVFPWGYAIHTSEGRWSYFINAKKFAEIEGLANG
jgi:DNA-binding XRE family transcriptional regulator